MSNSKADALYFEIADAMDLLDNVTADYGSEDSLGQAELALTRAREILVDQGMLRIFAEAPAMVEALRWALSMAEEAILVRENGDDPEDTPDICEMHRAELERHRAILSRIDGAGDTLPDAPVPHDLEPAQNGPDGHCLHCGRDNTGHEGEPCADDCPQYWEGKGRAHPEHPTGDESDALKAARGYASNPEQWNPPSPEQMAEILAMIDRKGEN